MHYCKTLLLRTQFAQLPFRRGVMLFGSTAQPVARFRKTRRLGTLQCHADYVLRGRVAGSRFFENRAGFIIPERIDRWRKRLKQNFRA